MSLADSLPADRPCFGSADDYLALLDPQLLLATPAGVLVRINPHKDLWQPAVSVPLCVLRRLALECVQARVERAEAALFPGKYPRE